MANERKIVEEKIRRILLKEYLMARTRRAGFGGLDIQRTPMGYRVTLVTERPGLVIGRKGATIKELTRAVEAKFGFENPQIEVQEVENASLNSQIMAEKLASALERGWHFRRAGHSTVRRIMGAGAKGCLVVISGKITGQRHRMEKFKAGHIKFCGEPKQLWMREGFAVAKVKLGVIGVKVQIMDPRARLPDEIEIVDKELETEVEEPAAEEAAEVKEVSGAKAEPAPVEKASEAKARPEEAKDEAETKEVKNGTAENERDKGNEQRGETEEAERTQE
ncbi:MAG: 30S ribosomal protein S3 [Thermoplasmata archaeon]|nr:30S ribosomal protein S3 [Thermoplasmata archaeon]MCK4455386.1 30S ribosomal protein S3 [Thermoplasmata archaeon]